MRKTTIVVAGAVGYVLGARAGRERYEQIRSTVLRLKSNPTVQQTAHKAADTARDVAPGVAHKVGEAAQGATQKIKGDSSSNGVNLEDAASPTTSTSTEGSTFTEGGANPGTTNPAG